MTPLRFANPSPPSGWVEDFHPQVVVHTRHTKNGPLQRSGPSKGGTALEGLWDQAAACSIGENGKPRLSATAL